MRVGIAVLIYQQLGDGLPLHKFDKAHEEFLANEVSGYAFRRTLEIVSTAPLEITLSLVYGLSPAILPIPQITYSTTS